MSALSILEKILSQTRLGVYSGQCLRWRHRKSSCRLCLESCPTGAISLDQSLEIDYSRCHGCGICASLCPTGVFELSDLPYEILLSKVRAGNQLEFACSRLPQGEDRLRVPCLGYLNEAILVGATAGGSQTVRLNVAACKQCPFALGLQVAVSSMKRANHILALFGLPQKILALDSGPVGSHSPSDNQHYSRREFFTYLGRGTQGMVARAIDSPVTNGVGVAKARVTFTTGLPEQRRLLLEYIKKLGQPVVDQVRADDLPFARVEIGDDCDGCGKCAAFCPTGALKSYDDRGRQVIDFSLRHCLACHLCRDICPREAIAYSAYINPYDLVADSRKILAEHKKSACPQCGQDYVAVVENSLCPGCRQKKKLAEQLVRI